MTNKLFTVCLYILVVEMCERLSYYTFAGSQRNYLMKLGFSNATSTTINSAFSVLTYLTPVLGGWLADARLGRFKTIVIFAVFYCVGVALAAISAHPEIEIKGLYLFAVMGLITLGSGGIKPNIANFGGDQYDISIPEEVIQQQQFFSYFYLVINIGAGVAYGYMVTLATNGAPPNIPKDYGFFSAYMVASGSMLIAFFIFILGSSKYTKKLPAGDSLRGLFYYIVRGAQISTKGKVALLGWVSIVLFLILVVGSAFVTNKSVGKSLSWVSLALAMTACTSLVVAHLNNSFLDDVPEHPQNLLSRQEAMDTLDVVPTLLVANVTFSINYNTMSGPFQSSACQMNLMVGSSQINGAFFNIADCFAIVLFVPLLENYIVPAIERWRGQKVKGIHRLVAGMSTTILAMISATALEIARRNSDVLVDGPTSNCAPKGILMSSLSGFLMFIPFGLIGLAEVFINPFLYFFTYEQTPPRARSISQAFNLMSMGAISNGFSTAITLALVEFYPENLNEGHVEYLYYVAGSIAVVGIPLTLFVQSKFRPKDFSDEVISGMDGAEKTEGVFVDNSIVGDGTVPDKK